MTLPSHLDRRAAHDVEIVSGVGGGSMATPEPDSLDKGAVALASSLLDVLRQALGNRAQRATIKLRTHFGHLPWGGHD